VKNIHSPNNDIISGPAVTNTLPITFAVGFLMTFSRPGVATFCIERRPENPSAVTASMMALQFTLASVLVTAGPEIISLLGEEYTFTIVGAINLFAAVPVVFITIKNWNIFDK